MWVMKRGFVADVDSKPANSLIRLLKFGVIDVMLEQKL
jgi:hypothetical protein